MKKTDAIPAMLTLLLLVGGCTLPAVKDPAPLPGKETASKSSQPEKPATATPPETKGKRVSLIPKETAAQATKETPPTPAPPQPQPPPLLQKQVFTDYNTGLTFTYQRPWHLVSTHGDGPILGRDGHSQLTARFATLTADKDKGGLTGHFYVPEDSLTGTIGKKIKSVLGLDDTRTAQGKTPLDVLLTKKQFPNLVIEKRYRGNNGGVVVQKCRHKLLPGPIQVYHIFIGDTVASYSLSEITNRQLKLEMQQIVLSTKKQ
ncbi:MAG: hypothetical protein KKE83_02935 [Proteobacteria bacterium]|nr:hypothetical protein [Pseudomonadota bacterium]MBU1547308.1 hypothetical protein [Pseudomonadota bacterium]MBU2618620.1 hypothetical protein [Pseudomonadota bacterium]